MPAASQVQRARDFALSKTSGWVLPLEVDYDALQPLAREQTQLQSSRAWPFYTSQQIYCKVCEWFVSWQPWQQRMLLCGITNRCSSMQLESLATTLEPIFHRDFVTTLRQRYPSAPFRKAKLRENRKGRGRRSKASSRNGSSMSMKSSSQVMKKSEMLSRDNTYDMIGIAEQKETASPPALAADEPSHEADNENGAPVEADLSVVTYVEGMVNEVVDQAMKMYFTVSEVPRTDVLGNVMRSISAGKDDVQTSSQEDLAMIEPHQEPVVVASEPAIVEPVQESEAPPAVTRSEPLLEDSGRPKTEGRVRVKRTGTRRSSFMRSGRSRRSMSLVPSVPRMPSMATLKSFIKQAMGMPLVNHHITIGQRINLLHSTDSSDDLEDEKPVHCHRSSLSQLSRNVSQLDFFDKGPVQAELRPDQIKLRASFQGELRTGGVRRPIQVADIYIPIQRMYKNIKWWGETPHDGKLFAKPNQQKLKLQFKQQIQQIWEWMSSWEDGEKLALLVEIIKLCETEQLSYFTQCLGQRLQEQLDISWMTDKLLLLIFSYLQVDDIETCSRVCRRWRYLCCMDELWLLKCHELGVMNGIKNMESLILEANSDDQGIDWKLAFLELQRITHETKSSLPLPRQLTFEGPTPDGMRRVGGKFLRNMDQYMSSCSDLSPEHGAARRETIRWLARCGWLPELDSEHGSSLSEGSVTAESNVSSRHNSLRSVPPQGIQSPYKSHKMVRHDSRSVSKSERRTFQLGSATTKSSRLLYGSEDFASEREDELASLITGMKAGGIQRSVLGGSLQDLRNSKLSSQRLTQKGASSKVDDEMTARKSQETALVSKSQGKENATKSSVATKSLKSPKSSRHVFDAQVKDKDLSSEYTSRHQEVASISRVGGRKKKKDDEGEVACDVRPQIFQARDILSKRRTSTSSERPLPLEAQIMIDQQAGRVASVIQVRKLQGHMDGVICVECDHRRLISGSMDRTIRVWDIRSGRGIHKLYGHKGGVCCLQFDNEELYSGSWDMSVQAWDIVHFKRLAVLSGHKGSISGLRMHAKIVLSSSHDGTVRVWCRTTKSCLHVFEIHRVPILAMTSGNSLIVTCGADRTLKISRLSDGECIKTITGPNQAIDRVTFRGQLIVGANKLGHVYFWNHKTGILEAGIQAHDAAVNSIWFHESRFFTASNDATIREWDLSTMACLRILQGHKGPVMDFKADDRYMVSCSTDGHIRIWELVQQMQSLSLGDSQDDIIRVQLINQRQL